MFQNKIKFRNYKTGKIIIPDFRAGLITADYITSNKNTEIGNEEYALTKAENIEYTRTMGFRPRSVARILGNDDPTGLVHGIGYSGSSIGGANYFRTKNGEFQKLYSNVWEKVGDLDNYLSIVGNYYDIFPFYVLGNDISNGTATGGYYRYIKNIGGMTVNEYVGKYIEINGEKKLIISNTEDTIYIYGKFEKIPIDGDTYSIKEKKEAIFGIGIGEIFWYDGTTYKQYNYTDWNIKPQRGVIEHNRLWIIDEVGGDYYIKFSEINIGDFFPKENWIKLRNLGKPTCIKNIQGRIIVYFENARVDIYGDNPDNLSIKYTYTHKGSIAGGSVANGNNAQFFISREGIEMLQAIDNGTIREGLSLSDEALNIDWKTISYNRPHGVVANDKYYLSIYKDVYVYDIEKSLKTGKNIFCTAKFLETSQTGTPSPGEWTCSKDCNGEAVFGCGGNVYKIDERLLYRISKNIISTIETGRLNLLDEKTKKIWRRIRVSFAKCERLTEFRLYVSYDGGEYELVKTTNDFIFQVFTNKIARDIQIKIEIEHKGETFEKGDWEFLGLELDYEPIQDINKY